MYSPKGKIKKKMEELKMKEYTGFFKTMEAQSRAGEEFPSGAGYAHRAWWKSKLQGSDTFECEDLPFENDLPDFVNTLKAAGVTRFAVTDRSTALMESMHCLANLGCSLEGLGKVTRTEERYGETETYTLPAVIFTLS